MNKTEFILTSLAEEGAEITQAATKIIKFGSFSKNPDTGISNMAQLISEMADAMAVFEMYYDTTTDDFKESFDLAKRRKKNKMNHFYNICKTLGTVT